MQRYRVSDLIKIEKKTFDGQVMISDTQYFDHRDTVNRINNYKNDKFHENAEEDAIFWNLAKPRLPHFVKKIGLKPRNFRMYARGRKNFIQSWIINQKFQKWAKDSRFAIDLEDLKWNASEYGTAVMKLVDEGSTDTLNGEEVDKFNLKACYPSRIYYDTSTENIVDSPIIEEHQMTESQIRDKAEAWGWDEEDIERILETAEKVKGTENSDVFTKYICLERHGDYKEDDDGWHNVSLKPKYMRHVVFGSGDNEVVYKEELKIDDCPYYDFAIGNYEGRHLRVGVYERLFQLQERVNQLVNENKQASTIASLLLFRSQEEDMVGVNLLKEAMSGQVLNSADLEQIGIDNRFLNSFLSELMALERQADLLCMTPDVSTVKDPENSPVRSRILATNEINSAFEPTRARLAYKLSEVLIKKIFPAQVAEWNKDDIIEIAENTEDIRIYDFYVLDNKVNTWLAEQYSQGYYPTQQEQEAYRQKTVERWNIEGRILGGLKGFFNFDYGLYLNPIDSDMNRGQINEAYDTLFNWRMGNPAIVNDPYFQQYLENNNITPIRFTPQEVGEMVAAQQPGAQAEPKQPDKLLNQVQDV
jgi:hypothetical protein